MIDITNVGTKQTQFLRCAYEQKRLAHSYLLLIVMKIVHLTQLIG